VLLDLVHRGDTTLSEARQRLQGGLDGVAALDDLRGQMLQAAAALRPSAQSLGTLPGDLARLMDGLSGKQIDLATWAAKLASTASALADPALASLKTALSQLAEKAETQAAGAAPVSVEPLVADLQKAIDSVPYIAVAEAIKKDLGGMLDRIRAGYTLGDAKAAVQRFIDAMPARYLREVIQCFPEPKVRDTLLVLLNDAEHDVEKFKENVEIWFNNAMDRVGGWYKRRSQWVIAILSFGATLFMNVDAVLVVKYLDTHPGVRDVLVTQAKAYADANSTAAKHAAPAGSAVGKTGVHGDLVAVSGERFEGVLPFDKAASEPGKVELTSSPTAVTLRETVVAVSKDASGVEFAFDSKPATTASTVTITAAGAAKGAVTVRVDPSLVAKLDEVHDQLLHLNLPIGWVREGPSPAEKDDQHGAARKSPSQAERDNMQVLPANRKAFVDVLSFHILGWILTALAASLGAPFWFDTLNRFISIRSAGKAPEESPKPPKNVPVPLEPGQSPREADLSAAAHR
jgi:hypothetical protein